MNKSCSFVTVFITPLPLVLFASVLLSNLDVLTYATTKEDDDEDMDNADLTREQEELLNGIYEWIEYYGYTYPVTFEEQANREMGAVMLVCTSLPVDLLNDPEMQEVSRCDSEVPKYKALCEEYNNIFDECIESDIDDYLERRNLQVPSEASLLEILPPPQIKGEE